MKPYNELSEAQKRYIDAVIKIMPSIATDGRITAKEIDSLYWKLKAERTADKKTHLGFPNWIIKEYKISTGVYVFPAPGISPENIVKTTPVGSTSIRTEVSNTKEDEKFFKDAINV